MSKVLSVNGYQSMDVSFNNVLEGTRQYFLGVPKPAQAEGAGQPAWPAGAHPPEEGTPAQSGAPAASSRPPSAAAAPTAAPQTVMAAAVPPRPPSEPLEPEPHIIHKATVMREAAEKRREMPEVEDEEEPIGTLSPPSHIIRKPPRTLPSPAPAPAAPCPSPARPPSAAPLPPAPAQESQLEPPSQYRAPLHRVPTPTARPPDHYAPGRPPDPYSTSRPPEAYMRYHYEANLQESGRSSHGAPIASPQPAIPAISARHSPQTYARLSSSLPQHSAARLRESAVQSPPAQRYMMPASQPPPPHNDRVPPIHHPQPAPPPQRLDVRSAQAYSPLQHRREPSPYGRVASHYDRHPAVPTRKYDPQQAYPGYRPSPTTSQTVQNHRMDTHQSVAYKHPSLEVMNAQYPSRPSDRIPAQLQLHSHDAARQPQRAEYPSMSRTADVRSGYHYPTPSTSTSRYPTNAQVPVVQNTTHQSRTAYRGTAAPKTNYEYSSSTSVQTSPARSAVKPGCANQQARMTVSVTSIVNQMNQTKQKHETPVAGTSIASQVSQPKQKRESPLDLSVKTVKNSADSSTTQDDVIDSASMEPKTLPVQPRPSSSSSSRPIIPPSSGYMASHKVDFAPNFAQYRERSNSQANINMPAQNSHPIRYNGAYETTRRPVTETYPIESQHHTYPDRNKYSVPSARPDYVHRIDLTRPVNDQRHDVRIRDDRPYIDERKRPAGPIVSNIPEKIVRYETWTSDSRIEHNMNQLTREQNELISRPVYSYSSYKQFEAYQKEQKRPSAPSAYHDHHPHVNHRYPNQPEVLARDAHHYHDRSHPSSNRHHVIQKIPNQRDIHAHHIDSHSGVPADKRVLSILRNSLETKQTGYADPARPPRQIPDLIVIDDVDDSVIEITDLTKDTDTENKVVSKSMHNQIAPIVDNHIQMPKAVDSIIRDSEIQKLQNKESKSPENDVASRIRTKAELKVMPPSQDNNVKADMKQSAIPNNERLKLQPKSQKQHLFNQIRQDNLRFESVIKSEKPTDSVIPEVKSEPMNIDEIEKDATISIKTESILEGLKLDESAATEAPAEDLDWASACDSFMEQLKVGGHKKKNRKRGETLNQEKEQNSEKDIDTSGGQTSEKLFEEMIPNIIIKQEPMDLDECEPLAKIAQSICLQEVTDELINTDNLPGIVVNEQVNESVSKSDRQDSNTIEALKQKKRDQIVKDKKDDSPPKSKKQDSPVKNKKVEAVTKDKKQNSPTKEKKKEAVKDKTRVGKDKKQDSPEKNKIQSTPQDKSHDVRIKSKAQESGTNNKVEVKTEKSKSEKKNDKDSEKTPKLKAKLKSKSNKNETLTPVKNEIKENEPIKTVIKEEPESTDDDEPLIKSKILKEKEKSDQLNYQLLKDLSEKSAYVKLECCHVDMNKNTRKSLDSSIKEKEERQNKRFTKQIVKSKGKSLSVENNNKTERASNVLSSDSDDDDLSVASRLRMRKVIKTEDGTPKALVKTPVKSSPYKKHESNNNNASSSSTPVRKAGFGDGSDFHPGWEEELYRYKRSLRMPTRLIAIPRGRSGGPFPRVSGAFFTRGSTSLPDLDPAPLSPAPSSAPSAATDDLYARRPDKNTLDSDLESNSSSSAVNRLQYDSEASTSTVFSTSIAKKKSSIVDVLIQKCGKKDDSKRKPKDNKDDRSTPKVIPKSTNPTELLPTPSLGLVKNGNKGSLSAKKDKLMEDIFYLGAFRKETVSAFRNAFINNTDGLIGATEEFSPVVLKTRTRTESRVLKQRATIKEVFGDERPASAPPTSCREEEPQEAEDEEEKETKIEIKKEPDMKPKFKPKKIVKDKLNRRSSSIRDGLRSTKSLKRNDAKGRLLRLKKRNSLMKSLANKRMKDGSASKHKKENTPTLEDKDKPKDDSPSPPTVDGTKRRLKRLFGRRKFSSGFDYIRKKKKIIRREDANNTNKIRRPAAKPSPESIHDIHKEIKSWFINKSIGETHLHRAARLGYTDCVAYCLEKMEADPSAKDNAGFTPLHVAAAKGHVRIARLLLQYGANVSAAAQGGIRPLHEACENAHVEVIRLLLSYGADPLLGTYAGQTPEELAEGPAARLIHLHISDVQGQAIEPWRFPHPAEIIDREENGCDPLASPPPGSPPPPPDATIEIQTTDAPLPPFYTLRTAAGQPADGLWCLLQDVTNLLQIKSKDSLLKQIHCGSGSPKELLREIRTQEFLERAQCHQLLCAGEKVNVRASKVALVRVTDKLRQLLKIETVLVS